MKKTVVTFVICLCVVFAIGSSILNRFYSKSVWVDSVEGNLITFEDREGNLWEYELDADKPNGQTVTEWTRAKLIMDNNKTEFDVTDDVIMSIRWTR